MKKMLLTGTAVLTLVSGSAMAADLSRAPPAPAPVYTKAPMMPIFTWTGCYVGGNVGGLWVKKDLTNALPFPGAPEGSLSISGWAAGGQLGCNYQVSTWVFGIQGDYDWASADGTANDLAFVGVTDGVKVKSLASVTGRVGYAMDRVLFYVKGGGAWETDDYRAFNVAGLASAVSDSRTGWTFGGGGEYAFTDWLTGFVEYDYYDFGTKSEALIGTLPAATVSVKETKSLVKGGINFKFGGWH